MAKQEYEQVTCPVCNGSGTQTDWTNRRQVKCTRCGGTGTILVSK